MSQHAPLAGSTGAPRSGDDAPRVGARPQRDELDRELDSLFVDADQHGPRWPALVRRIVPVLLLVLATIGAASSETWRRFVIDAVTVAAADALLVGPVLIALVVMSAALAPLARVRALPLLALAGLLLCASSLLTLRGDIVASSVLGAPGAALLGIAAARAVRRAVWLLPMLLAAGVSDVHSVERGITNDLLESGVSAANDAATVAPTLTIDPTLLTRLDLLVLHLPAAGSTWLIGMVDVVALGLLLGLAHLFWLPLGRTAVALGGVLCGAVLLDVPVPLLPVLGLAWLAVHARLVWRATRFELRRLTYMGG